MTFSPADFQGFRHGYAERIYKGQGKTLDRTEHLYHTEHWRVAACYGALTRQRESAQVFVARKTARDAGQLARQVGRGEVMGRPTTKSARSTPVGPLLKLGVRRAELAQQVPQAEKAEAAAFQQAEPAVTAELVQRQAKAGLAREVLDRAAAARGRPGAPAGAQPAPKPRNGEIARCE